MAVAIALCNWPVADLLNSIFIEVPSYAVFEVAQYRLLRSPNEGFKERMNPQIRKALVSDAAEIAELIRFTSLACCFSAENPCPEWYLESIKVEQVAKLLQDEQMEWVVAIHSNRLSGVFAIASKRNVKYFFVHPQVHGSGVGKLLWRHAEQSGFLGPSLTVRSSLFAIPVYSRLGFMVSEPVSQFKGMQYQTMIAVRD